MTTKRIQLRRAKGWRMPPNTVSCARPGRWGNPYRIDGSEYGCPRNAAEAVQLFRVFLSSAAGAVMRAEIGELRGHDLACWCALPKPGEPDVCHAAVLLELAR